MSPKYDPAFAALVSVSATPNGIEPMATVHPAGLASDPVSELPPGYVLIGCYDAGFAAR